MKQKAAEQKETLGYNYNGVPMYCSKGVHENIFETFSKRNVSKSANILILGSGGGAMEQRLLDNGYTSITSVELVPESFKVKGTKFLSLDLNQDFSHIGKYDVIFAIEVIEHLENQFHFIRNVKSLLHDTGYFYLTSPSVDNTFVRIKFFISGKLHWFEESEIRATGHISPIFLHILKLNLESSELTVTKHFTNETIWKKSLQHPSAVVKMIYSIFFIISRLMRNKNDFEVNLFEITHKNR